MVVLAPLTLNDFTMIMCGVCVGIASSACVGSFSAVVKHISGRMTPFQGNFALFRVALVTFRVDIGAKVSHISP